MASKRRAPGFMISPKMLDSYEVSLINDKDFWSLFIAAADGAQNALSEFVRPWHGRPPAHEWNVLRARIFARDDYTCRYCGERGKRLEYDHVLPVIRGGSNDDDNLVTACRACNRNKRDKTLEEWKGAGLGANPHH